jgi:hypothetical protein
LRDAGNNRGGRGGENDGRSGSSVVFHRQTISPDASWHRVSAFSSNLVRRHGLTQL